MLGYLQGCLMWNIGIIVKDVFPGFVENKLEKCKRQLVQCKGSSEDLRTSISDV